MYTLLKPLTVREDLLKRGIKILTPELLTRLYGTSAHQTKYFMEQQAQTGLFVRIKRGLYALKTDPPAEEELANALYKPSYISFEYALAYYNILPELPNTLTSATTKPTRLFMTGARSFSYKTIKKEAFTGYLLEKKSDRSFLIAEPEKALADYLYFVSLRKSLHNERLFENLVQAKYYKTEKLQKDKLIYYAKLFQRKNLINLVSTILK